MTAVYPSAPTPDSTTIAVFSEGSVIFADAIPVGGSHVTNDIARGLSTPLIHAERMKTLYGHAILAPTDEREMIDVPQIGESDEGSLHQVPRSLLVGIIQPRLEETFELVRSRLEASGFDLRQFSNEGYGHAVGVAI